MAVMCLRDTWSEGCYGCCGSGVEEEASTAANTLLLSPPSSTRSFLLLTPPRAEEGAGRGASLHCTIQTISSKHKPPEVRD